MAILITSFRGQESFYNLPENPGDKYTVGRSPACDICEPEDDTLSGTHCHITRTEDGVLISDNDSSNGLQREDQLITEEPMQMGVTYFAGEVAIRMEEDSYLDGLDDETDGGEDEEEEEDEEEDATVPIEEEEEEDDDDSTVPIEEEEEEDDDSTQPIQPEGLQESVDADDLALAIATAQAVDAQPGKAQLPARPTLLTGRPKSGKTVLKAKAGPAGKTPSKLAGKVAGLPAAKKPVRQGLKTGVAKRPARPAAKAVVKPVANPASKGVAKPAAKSLSKPGTKRAAKLGTRRAAKQISKPAAVKPAAKTVAKPTVPPVAKPAPAPAVATPSPAAPAKNIKPKVNKKGAKRRLKRAVSGVSPLTDGMSGGDKLYIAIVLIFAFYAGMALYSWLYEGSSVPVIFR